MSTLASVIVIDLSANRPAASIPGRLFFASDTGAKYRDNGAAWDVLTQAQTLAAVTHKFLTEFDAATGLFAAAQPAASDISGLAASATIDTTDAANISSGTLPAARLPNPSAATLGGVESAAAAAHQWIDSISPAGVPHLSQPAESDLALTDIATNDVSTARHGLAPKAPNDATRYLDGTGAYSTPAGGTAGAVTHTGGDLTADQPVFGAGAADTKVGTKTGNTDQLVSASGTAPQNYPILYDANGNAVGRQPRGNTTVVQLADSTAAPASGDLASFDANGNVKDSAASVARLSQNILTTKGDLMAFGTAPARLAAGTDGQVLTSRSTAPGGFDWETPGGGAQPYDVVFAYPGAPPNAALIQLLTFTRAVSFPGNLAGSFGHCGGNPTSTALYTLCKNGTPCGSVSIAPTGSFTFSTTGGAALSFVPGDTLSALTPASDATLSGVTMTFSGTR